MGGNTGRPNPFRPTPHVARKMWTELARPAFPMKAENSGLSRKSVGRKPGGQPAYFFLTKAFYDKTFNVQQNGKL